MDDFLLIVTTEWIEVENPHTAFGAYADLVALQDLVSTMDWYNLRGVMEAAGIIPDGALISEARIVNTGGSPTDYRFWYRV